MEINRRQARLMGFLLVLSIVPMWARAQPGEPAQPVARTDGSQVASGRNLPAGPAPLPQTIRVGSADVPLTDVVPSAEAALSHLQQVLGKTRALEYVKRALAVAREA